MSSTMLWLRLRAVKKDSTTFLTGSAHVLYHVGVVALSAAFALSLPVTVSFIAREVLVYWSFIGNEKLFLVSVEIGSAIVLVLFLNFLRRGWRDRRLSSTAKAAGLVLATPAKGLITLKRIKRMKGEQGFAKDVMVVGSTGFRTFVDPKGELNQVLHNCREAKIMLLHPWSDGARARVKSLVAPGMTLEDFSGQISASIAFLKGLKSMQKLVRLKLYQDAPFLKLIILGDYLWVQHYHAGIDIDKMPKYLFAHNQNHGSLYVPFYHYFLSRWNSPDIPEYDLETDELIHRDSSGNEIKREQFTDPLPGPPS
ncbi:MAG: uncharacterized protein H6Q55_1008 [Deltaproteobacteria bacterium]|nr:uncharacterized protein [Deltaproteobacteria bacterium]